MSTYGYETSISYFYICATPCVSDGKGLAPFHRFLPLRQPDRTAVVRDICKIYCGFFESQTTSCWLLWGQIWCMQLMFLRKRLVNWIWYPWLTLNGVEQWSSVEYILWNRALWGALLGSDVELLESGLVWICLQRQRTHHCWQLLGKIYQMQEQGINIG